jgi:hypothetical protein
MQRTFFSILACCFFICSCGQDKSANVSETTTEKIYSYHLGNTNVKLVVQQFGTGNELVMINLHDDEFTSVAAARKVLAKTGGVLIRIENAKQRLITFRLGNKSWVFDPNRMFTRAGIEGTLTRFNERFSEPVVDAVERFAGFILEKIPGEPKTLVALHNNDEGKLAIGSYQPGGAYENDVMKVSASIQEDPDNFFFTTDQGLYEELARDSFNVVLQENRKAKDDGSLSIYYGRKNRSYVNVEAQHDQVADQERMIRVLVTKLGNQVAGN